MSTLPLHRVFVLSSESSARALWAFLKANWRALADSKKPLAVTVMHYKPRRTDAQNARLHAMLQEIAAQAWVDGKQYSAAAWKEFYRRQFLPVERVELPGGAVKEETTSTRDLDLEAFAEFMTRVEQHAVAELGVQFSH